MRTLCTRWKMCWRYTSRPCGDTEVLVCLDETSKQQVKETRAPRPARPGGGGGL